MLTRTLRQNRQITGEHRDDEDDHHQRMFANLAAAVWVATLMVSAYYVFSTLSAVS